MEILSSTMTDFKEGTNMMINLFGMKINLCWSEEKLNIIHQKKISKSMNLCLNKAHIY